MWTYRVDTNALTFEKFEYDKRTSTEIWVNGKRRDIKTKRYQFIDDLQEVHSVLEDCIIELEAAEQVKLNQKYRMLRESLNQQINDASHSFGRL